MHNTNGNNAHTTWHPERGSWQASCSCLSSVLRALEILVVWQQFPVDGVMEVVVVVFEVVLLMVVTIVWRFSVVLVSVSMNNVGFDV